MRLELDLGNSYIKWRIAGGSDPGIVGRIRLHDLEQLPEQIGENSLDAIYVGSVAAASIDSALSKLCLAHWGVAPEFAHVAKVDSVPLIPVYTELKKLGVDRWLAMLAARVQFSGALMVVDVGSAITIDEIDDSINHKGGYIVPGFNMLQTSLLGSTAKVRFDQLPTGSLAAGRNTGECVASGAEWVLRGIAQQLDEWRRSRPNAKLVVTGGDAERLLGYLVDDGNYEHLPDLVLEGLKYAERRFL